MDSSSSQKIRLLENILQRIASPMFVINRHHTIIYWNNALAQLTGMSTFQMVGTKNQWKAFYSTKREVMADLVVDNNLERLEELYTKFSSSLFTLNAYQAEGWFDNLNNKRRYLFFEAVPVLDENNQIFAAVETLEDITERKLIEESVLDHNTFLQTVMDAIPSLIYYKGEDQRYLGCNTAFLDFMGHSAVEVVGKKLEDFMPEKYARETASYDYKVIDSKKAVSYETTMINSQHEECRLIGNKAPFFKHDGSLAGIVGSFSDITELNRLHEKINRLSMAVDQSSSTIVMTDVDGTIEYVNRKFTDTSGYTAEEAIGKNPRILKSGELSPEIYTGLWKTISSGKTWNGEFHNRRKDDSLYWESASIAPLVDDRGTITGYLAVKDDITERKQNDARFAELFRLVEHGKREWEETLDHLRDFVILADSNHCIIRYNRILADLTGNSVDKLAGLDWRELLKKSGFIFVSFAENRGELLHSSSARYYDINIYPIIEQNENKGFVVSLNDTTELRNIAKELEKAYSELEETQLQLFQQEKMASVGQLAAGVAHEINNPMGFISSNLGSLEKYVNRLAEFISLGDQAVAASGDSAVKTQMQDARKRLKIDHLLDDSHQLIAESLEGASRVRRIVQDLKSFSRVDQAETAYINLNEALETTINIARNEIKYVATLNREFGDIPQIRCFPQQLNQVFLNLLVNAAHAMEEKQGTITVRTFSKGEDVLVQVSDTGSGMPEDVMKRIFEPFFTTKEVGKGTGLGLSISYDIIKKHGGDIMVESEVGVGTDFTVRLPVNSPLQ
ncbi:MAG: PAS domain S-box protein [Pedobacter sp.]